MSRRRRPSAGGERQKQGRMAEGRKAEGKAGRQKAEGRGQEGYAFRSNVCRRRACGLTDPTGRGADVQGQSGSVRPEETRAEAAAGRLELASPGAGGAAGRTVGHLRDDGGPG